MFLNIPSICFFGPHKVVERKKEKEENKKKYVFTMASYTCDRQHEWRKQASWTNLCQAADSRYHTIRLDQWEPFPQLIFPIVDISMLCTQLYTKMLRLI